MKTIKCSCGVDILVDDEDFKELEFRKFLCDDGRVVIMYHEGQNIKKLSIAEYLLGKRFGFVHDHLDRNKHNNQKSNLRFATSAQNNANKSKNKGSFYKGVSFSKRTSKWLAKIQVNREQHYIGLFTDIVEAAKAYDKEAIKYHGEFAVLNFPICPPTTSTPNDKPTP